MKSVNENGQDQNQNENITEISTAVPIEGEAAEGKTSQTWPGRVWGTVQNARESAWGEVIETFVVAVVLALLLRAFVIQAFYIPSESMVPTLEMNDHILVNKFIYHFIREPRTGDVVVFRYPVDPEYPDGNKERYQYLMPFPMGSDFWWDKEEDQVVRYSPRDFIKRVIGTPGDTVRVENNRVYVNGVELPDDYILEPMKKKDYALRIAGSHLSFKDGMAYVDGRPVSEGVTLETQNESSWGTVTRVLPGGFIQNMDPSNFEKGVLSARDIGIHEIVVPEGMYFAMGDNRNNSSDSREWGFFPAENIHGKALVLYYPFNRIGLVE